MKKLLLIILLIVIANRSYSQCTTSCTTPKITNGIIAYYPFCGNANDASVNGFNGLAAGASLTTDRFGNTNSAYSFNGINNYIGLPMLGTYTNISISGWFYINNNSQGKNRSIFNNITTNPGSVINAVSNGNIGFTGLVIGQSTYTTSNKITLDSINTWHHFTYTFSTTDSARLYLDGHLVSSVVAINQSVILNAPRIGGFDTTAFWNGKIDDIILFNRVLSASEVSLLAQNGNPPVVTKQPIDINTQPNTNAYFKVSASGTNNNYQWQVSENGGTTWSNITTAGSYPTYSGFNSDSLNLNIIAKSNNNFKYRCIVRNTCDSTVSNIATLSVSCDATNCNLPLVTNGLVAYYPFCGNANDASGNGHNGSANNTTLTTDRFGMPSSAYSFNGVNSYIQIPNHADLGLNNKFTISLWYKTDDVNRNMRLIGKASEGTSNSWNVDHRNTNQIRLIAASVLSPIPFSDTNYATNNNFTHLVITYNDTLVKFFKNGRLFSVFPISGSTPANSNPVRIGVNNLLNGDWFKGTIDDIIIYNRALDSQEVQNVYSIDPPLVSINPTNQYVETGSDAYFKTKATGTNLNFNWQYSDDNGFSWVTINSPGTNPTYAGYNSDYLTLTNVTLNNDKYTYRCIISNLCDTVVTSSAKLEVFCNTSSCNIAPITNGLVAYYPFCGNARDISGNSNNGTVVGATLTTDRFGNTNGAYYFNGTNAHITGNASSFPLGNAARTISGWVYKQSFPTLTMPQTIFMYGADSATRMFGMTNGNSSSVYTFGLNQGSAANDLHETHVYNLNQWYHYAITYKNGTVKLFVNGQLYTTSFVSTLNTKSGNFDIGSVLGANGFFEGKLDDIGIWNRDLSETEIQMLYSGKLQPFISITADKNTICQNSTVKFTARAIHGGNSPTFQWKIDGVISGGNDSIFETSTLTPNDTVICTLISSEYCALPNSANSNKISIVVNPVPNPTINGVSSICSNTSTTYSTTLVAGRSYKWTIIGGVINSGQNTNSVNVTWGSAGLGTISLKDSIIATGCNGTNALVVSIDEKPTPTITGSNSVCANATTTYSTPLDPAHGYFWTISGGTISNGQGTNSIDVIWGAAGIGIITVTDSVLNSSCKTKTPNFIVFKNNAPNPVISGSTTFCNGDSVKLSTGSISGATYQWRLNGTDIIGANSSSYTATIAGDYTVYVITTAGCSAESDVFTIQTHPSVPNTIVANGLTTICQGNSVELAALNINGTNYKWAFNNVPIPGAFSSTYNATDAGYYYLNFVNQYGCLTASNTIQVIVNPAPNAFISSLSSTKLCEGNSVYLITQHFNGQTYQWMKDGFDIVGSTQDYLQATTAGDYSLKLTNSFKCSQISNTLNVTVDPKPTTSSITGETNIIIHSTKTYSVVDNPSSTYNWITGTGVGLSNTSTIDVYWGAAGNTQLKVIETNMFGCSGDTISLNIRVDYAAGFNEFGMHNNNISIKPNPFIAEIMVTKTFKPNEQNNITIYDALGRKILDQVISENNNIINTENIQQPGIYFLQIEDAIFKVLKN